MAGIEDTFKVSEKLGYGTAIGLMFSVFPAILATPSAAAIIFYRLDSARVKQIEQDLRER
jgi:Na+/melibiose symporter-like transporter